MVATFELMTVFKHSADAMHQQPFGKMFGELCSAGVSVRAQIHF